MTLVTILGLSGFLSSTTHAFDVASLQNVTETFTHFKSVVDELETAYNKGTILKDIKTINKVNEKAAIILKYCESIETRFQEKAPELLARKQEAKNRSIERSQSLLDTEDMALKTAQAYLIVNYETAKYCLGLTGQVRASIVQKLE